MTQTIPEIKCPKCGSTQLTANKKGFSGTKAVGGAILTGGIGLLAGTIGSNKINITCLACGNQFRPGGDLEGVKRKQQQQAEAMKSPAFWVFFGVIMLLFFWVFKGCFFSSDSSNKNVTAVKSDIVAPTEAPPTQRVNYDVFSNDADGAISKIIVNPKFRNEKDIRLLGETLKYDTRNNKIVILSVYDNIKAATLAEQSGDLTKSKEAFWDKHLIASYTKNVNSGLHRMIITLHGTDGKSITVEY